MKYTHIGIGKKLMSAFLALLFAGNANFIAQRAFAADDNIVLNIDFSDMSTVPQCITTGAVYTGNVTSVIEIAEDCGTAVLKWNRSDRKVNSRNSAYLDIALDNPVTAEDYPLLVEYSAKLSAKTARSQFSLKGTTTSDTEITANYGVSKWYSYADYQVNRVKALDNELDSLTVNDDKENGIFQQYNHSKTKILYNNVLLNPDKYYVHRYIINADGTYTYEIREDSAGSVFEKPFGERTLYLSNNLNTLGEMPSEITSLYSTAGYFNGNTNNFTDAQKADMALDEADCYKYIKVIKHGKFSELANGIYVSPYAADIENGTAAAPFSDINYAIKICKAVKELTGQLPNIYLKKGDYYLSDTVYIDADLSGLSISAYDGEVNLFGLCRITEDKISIAQASDCDGRLPDELIGKIVRIDLSQMSEEQLAPNENYRADRVKYDSYGDNEEYENLPELIYHCELVDGNKVKTVARWPDEDWAYMGKTTEHDGANATFVTENSLEWDKNIDDIKIRNFRSMEYHCMEGDVTGFDAEAHTVDIYQSYLNFPFMSGSRYYFFNIPEEITQKGEYYINYEEKAAYYYPENEAELDNIAVTSLKDGIIRIADNTSDILIDGINFSGTRGSAVTAYNSKNIDIKNCKFSNTGDCAVYLGNCTQCDLSKNCYDNIGNVCVYVRGGDVPSLTSGENTITESRFTNGGRVGKTYTPFISASGVGTLIEHNYFYNHMHSAILFYGNDNIIQKNIFDNVVNATQDAGAVYAGRKTTQWGNVISNNIFKNIRTYFADERYGDAHAIYIDDTMPGTTIEDNLFYNCSSAINIGGGIGNKIIGNLVYDCYEAGAYGYRSTIEQWSHKGGSTWTWIKALEAMEGYNEELWFEKYPAYKELVEDLESGEYEELGEWISGTAEETAKEPILKSHLVKNAVVKDNLFICENVEYATDAGLRSVFTFADAIRDLTKGKRTVWENGLYATYEITPSGEFSHNYVNDDLSNVTVTDGKKITIDSKLYNKFGYFIDDGYTNGFLNTQNLGKWIFLCSVQEFEIPDVSDAGPTVIDVSDIDADASGEYVIQSEKNANISDNDSGVCFKNDFEKCIDGASVQAVDKNMFTYNAYPGSAEFIKKENDSNTAISLEQTDNEIHRAYLEIFTDPIETQGEIISLEYSIKSTGEAEGLADAASIFGYDKDRPSYVSAAAKITQNQTNGALVFGDTQIATLDELKSGFVTLKITLDAANNAVKIYKKTDNQYVLAAEKTDANIPECIDRIQFSMHNYNAVEDTKREYLIDDIIIYKESAPLLKYQSGFPVFSIDSAKKNDIYLNHSYLPDTGIGVVIAAMYDSSGKLLNAVSDKYIADVNLKLNVPDMDGCYVKYFTWENENSLSPVNDSVEFR